MEQKSPASGRTSYFLTYFNGLQFQPVLPLPDKEERDQHSRDRHQHAYQIGRGIAEPGNQGQSPKEGTQCVSDIEGGLYRGRGNHFGSRCGLYHQHLYRGDYGKRDGSRKEHEQQGQVLVVGEQVDQRQVERHDQQQQHDGPGRGEPVGQFSAQYISNYHSESGQDEDIRHRLGRELGHIRKQRGNIADPAEQAAKAECRDQDDQPRFRLPEELQLALDGFLGPCFQIRHPGIEGHEGQQPCNGNDDERIAPGKMMSDVGPDGNSGEVRNRQPGKHDGDRLRFLPLVGQAAGHHGPDAKKGTVGQSRKQAGGKQELIAGRDDRKRIEDGQHCGQDQEHLLGGIISSDDHQ